MQKIGVVLYGCGVMGRAIAETILEKNSLCLLGAIDIAPELVGRPLGAILRPPRDLQIPIQKDPTGLFSRITAEVVVLTTTSHLPGVLPQIRQCVEADLNVVSTCEELSYPWQRYPELARELDSMAKQSGVSVVGTGINPGFLMDALPLFLTAACLRVDAVRVVRMMNSSRRRIPFQKKVGTGLSPEEFKKEIDDGSITGHVGLVESIHMIAAGLHWDLDEAVEIPPDPVLAPAKTQTGVGAIETGKVIGLVSMAFGKRRGTKRIILEFHAHAGVKEEYDEIIIDGNPPIHQKILGGVHGDLGTVAVTTNAIPRVVEAAPGLWTMKDLPPAPAVE